MSKLILVTGDTYPHREALRALGGRWNPTRKGWMVPEGVADKARALVDGGGRSHSARNDGIQIATPTEEQLAIRDAALNSDDNLFLDARAGASKTTTSLWLLGMLDVQKKAMVAFNVDIKEDIKEKASSDTKVMTMNGFGFGACLRAWNVQKATDIKVDRDYLFEVFKARFGVPVVRERASFFGKVKKLIELAKGALVDTSLGLGAVAEDMSILSVDYDLDLNGEAAEAIKIACETMEAQRLDRSKRAGMDFVDQMWLPVVHDLPLPRYDVLVIDEAQDTNALQLEMLARAAADGTRVIAVGDRRQCIYSFRGADHDAVDNIINRFNMRTMPLTVTFRCGKAIVAEAQKIVPDFKAGPKNAEGIVRDVSISKMFDQIRPGDFVISRTNAPLVAACMHALSRGIPSAVVGRDVGGTLMNLVKKMKASNVKELEERLEVWLQKEVAKFSAKVPVNETAIEAATDKVESLLAIISDCDDMAAVQTKIETLFVADASENRVDFTTTHKAKGRERARVFLFRDTFLLPKRNKTTGEWLPPSEEEYNLLYVAITRAKNELVYVDGARKLGKAA